LSKKLENNYIEIRISEETGAIIGIRDKSKDIELIAEPRLAQSFRLLIPLPNCRNNLVEGNMQKLR
jgi:hypothetical protein